ncbi:AraC family transcriptional regulator [Gammaproteobacteria bacterium LSUCC0057]|uniref:AraC family transcriptional regulator n=1 Tax=Gammaproteobacteria bacterium LSUCC0057 TaxID=2559237 RepID=A0A4Y8UKP0_9GAMM|nr:AraC family transcriptional regulator [Gammaproteobacteria bacterium LSUCC0057]
MEYISVAASKFHDLIDYLERLEVDASQVIADAGLTVSQLQNLKAGQGLSALHYSRLYQAAVKRLQDKATTIPWAAGLGSDLFEFLCHALISASSLGEALSRAERFGQATQRLTGHRVRLHKQGALARLHYDIDTENISPLLIPPGWPRASSLTTVARASGLLLWHGLSGWLVGHALETYRVFVAAEPIGASYTKNLQSAVNAPVEFDARQNCIEFPAAALDYRLVQNHSSLQQFLDESVYQLTSIERQPSSISAAIKGLLGTDFSLGMPSFGDIAERLHLSESSLRRRLLSEETSFQIIKDQVRCESAIQQLGETDIKVNDLAELLGFAEPSSFVRSFRHWTGMTPKAYRDNLAASSYATTSLSEVG